MAKKKTDKTEEQFAVVEETLTRTEQWVENNQKTLSTIVFAIVGVIALASTPRYPAPTLILIFSSKLF